MKSIAETWEEGNPDLRGRLLYDGFRNLLVGLFRGWFSIEVVGREHIPKTGAFVLAPVHRAYIDTPLMCAVTRRRLRYMGKEEAFGNRIGNWSLRAVGGFPVSRGEADRDAIRRAEDVLRLGQPLVMFPEGTRKDGPVVEEVFDGPAFVAARVGVPIVPVGIAGSDVAMPPHAKSVKRTKVVLVIGPPLPPPPKNDRGRVPRSAVASFSSDLRAAIQDVYDAAKAHRAETTLDHP